MLFLQVQEYMQTTSAPKTFSGRFGDKRKPEIAQSFFTNWLLIVLEGFWAQTEQDIL